MTDSVHGRAAHLSRCETAAQAPRRTRSPGCSGTTRATLATPRRRVAWVIVDILRRAGIKPPSGRTGPRIHDLRHSMVVNRILEWYRSGINPQDKLPFLATYLGHRDIHSTLVYITVTQDLLQQASERFRTVGARCPHRRGRRCCMKAQPTHSPHCCGLLL